MSEKTHNFQPDFQQIRAIFHTYWLVENGKASAGGTSFNPSICGSMEVVGV